MYVNSHGTRQSVPLCVVELVVDTNINLSSVISCEVVATAFVFSDREH